MSSLPENYVFPPGFYGLYTRLDAGEPWEEAARSRSGKHADIVVHFGEQRQLVFWRGASYLPYWKTEQGRYALAEIVPRKGDGPPTMPDRINRYSHVRLIENQPDRVVVHWRYVPEFDPRQRASRPPVDWHNVVDELFTIRPNGRVTRTVRKGTPKIGDWIDPLNATVQELELRSTGVVELSLTPARAQDLPGPAVTGSPVRGPAVGTPAASWSFDEGLRANRELSLEGLGRSECAIQGPKAMWRPGISGTALEFDGYQSAVVLPSRKAPDVSKGLTLEAWLAPAARPQLDWAPIVHCSEWGAAGYFFGIDPDGYLGLHVAVSGKWRSLKSTAPLVIRQWQHVAATCDTNAGRLVLYINGEKRGEAKTAPGVLQPAETDLMIGCNGRAMPAIKGRVSVGTWPSLFGFDGLIDEVRIHDKVLTEAEISRSFNNFFPGDAAVRRPALAVRRFPANPNNMAAAAFGGQYTRLHYHEAWDNLWRVGDYPDVLIQFDAAPVRMAFWRGASYGFSMITENGRWVGDQSSENWRDIEDPGSAEGCCEHMSDKQCRHSHVRIIENTPARVVVHWRYALVDSRYVFPNLDPRSGWGDWADEYWTIYPDVLAVRHLERGKIWDDSWTETEFFNQPGEFPEDNVELRAYTVVSEDGTQRTYSWEHGIPDIEPPEPIIGMVNTKSVFKPFNILPPGAAVSAFDDDEELIRSFPWWNHFPVNQVTSDGLDARNSDRASSCALVYPAPGDQNYLLYGLTDGPAKSLLPLYKSWAKPPGVSNIAGGELCGYDQTQRAYALVIAPGETRLSFTMEASAESPIVNPCWVIRGWSSAQLAELTIDGAARPPGRDFRQGTVRDIDGMQVQVIWIRESSTKPRSFVISRTTAEAAPHHRR